MTYRVKFLYQPTEHQRWPMAFDAIHGKNADEAISNAIKCLRRDGFDGIVRWPEAENTADAHDYVRRTW